MRINKYISEKGICSRREADKILEQKRITINDSIAQIGTVVKEGDIVKIDGNPLKKKDKTVYIAFNKPIGIVSTTDKNEKNNMVDFINYPKRIFHIGRLDKDSEGLIFLTNDGDIVNKILRAGNNHEKEYIVTVDKPITQDFLNKMSRGVPILGKITNKCSVSIISKYVFRIILTEGLNRQIRRMCEVLGCQVLKLKRVRIMNVKLGDLPIGKWRYLADDEVAHLNKLVQESSKTEDASK